MTHAAASDIRHYIPLVEFLGTFLGKDCEVVLHDPSNIPHSVTAIKGSHISGRSVGAPLTDLALKFLKDKTYEQQDWVMDYETVSADGKPLRSATYFIKDTSGALVGMLCLNLDITVYRACRDMLSRLVDGSDTVNDLDTDADANRPNETFPNSIEALTDSLIQDAISTSAAPPDRMTPDEKLAVMRVLSDKGVFLIKGSVSVVARHLGASEATIYRYLNRIGK